ncbi:ATP-binding cassette domain-containing protein [Niameybacter massiliensis]|uniref:ATP-binding cassette domain-containing protein n=1 Tax=Holtiella tumoricola TaxID=3018743 RepID=A0AA42DL80_9FIRM|nr:ATP-binding cassette domain-containing protein [Holtiella tumoricola]MDA3731121.1 ATP-binding cassette domain-containing protein [Holtiella tumoricola]
MIRIEGLSKSYENIQLYKDFNIEIEEGKTTVLLGASGSGKTTFIRMLLGIESYEKGNIIGLENKNISVVFQEDRLIPWLNVSKNIEIVLKAYLEPDAIQNRIEEILKLVELLEYKDCEINKLSGGMKRRVALARALAYDGELLIMDEPFKGQDYALKLRLLERIKILIIKEKRTVVFVTHDMEEASLLGDVLLKFEERPVKFYKI